MSLFVDIDLLQVGVEGIREAGFHKVGLSVIGETLLVELALEIFQGQGIVEDYRRKVPVSMADS